MKAIVLSATLLALVAAPACNKRDHRANVPSQTTTTSGTTTTDGTRTDGTTTQGAPREDDGTPRSASEAQQRRDEGSVGPFGSSSVPAPVAPTSPAEKTAPAK